MIRGVTAVEWPRSFFAVAALLFLHSGPWTLVLAAAGVYYAAQFAEPAYLMGVIAGFGFAVALVLLGSLIAVLRQRRPTPERPLTQERLVGIRRRFFWGNSLLFAVLAPLGAVSLSSFSASEAPGFVVLMFIVGFPAGWVWSWFMWQWYGAALQVKEKRRKERENRDAV